MDGRIPPSVIFGGRVWSSDELTGIAAEWLGQLTREGTPPDAARAFVLDNHPQSVAALFALSCLPGPVIVLPVNPAGWRCAPAIPSGTPVVLLPAQRALVPAAEALGLRSAVLSEPSLAATRSEPPRFMTCMGFVLLTSGSTGSPKPVLRRVSHVFGPVAARATALGLAPGAGVITAQPLAHAQGFSSLLTAAWLGSRFALLSHSHPAPVLALFASGDYQYWVGSAVAADVLRRYPGPGRLPAPRICMAPGQAAPSLHAAFRERFGVPLRQNYSTTETGSVTVEAAAEADVQWDTVGRPIPGVEVRVADDPRMPLPTGTPGRIWIKTAWPMDGYGFPPRIEPPSGVDGWWSTKDLGVVDPGGRLCLRGRLDDCIRTRAGTVVNLAEIAAALRDLPGVTDAAVLPVDGESGPSIGAVVETDGTATPEELRARLAETLPPWAQPRLLELTDALPRLASGRLDRLACITRLALGGSRDGRS